MGWGQESWRILQRRNYETYDNNAGSTNGFNYRAIMPRGNERLTGALLDRITHRVHIIEANGESYRLKDAKKRAKRKHR